MTEYYGEIVVNTSIATISPSEFFNFSLLECYNDKYEIIKVTKFDKERNIDHSSTNTITELKSNNISELINCTYDTHYKTKIEELDKSKNNIIVLDYNNTSGKIIVKSSTTTLSSGMLYSTPYIYSYDPPPIFRFNLSDTITRFNIRPGPTSNYFGHYPIEFSFHLYEKKESSDSFTLIKGGHYDILEGKTTYQLIYYNKYIGPDSGFVLTEYINLTSDEINDHLPNKSSVVNKVQPTSTNDSGETKGKTKKSNMLIFIIIFSVIIIILVSIIIIIIIIPKIKKKKIKDQ